MKKKRYIALILAVVVISLTVLLSFTLITKRNNEAAATASMKQAVQASASSLKASKWKASVATNQSIANAKYRASEAASSSIAKDKEAQSQAAEQANKIDFSRLSNLDQAKAAIFYGIGNAEYFVNDGYFRISKNAYSQQGVSVSHIELGDLGEAYTVVPTNGQSIGGAPVFALVQLGIINSNGDREEGITYGKADYPNSHSGDLTFVNDPNESNWGAGVPYKQVNDWINQHGGKEAIEKIVISSFNSDAN
ncbi:hypothetical protein [Lacticaseibacillus paracasei]|uniref:Lipoprotein n=1 Tax=Lacticaseibacillus paracasei TaxID=1597 RepID=A0AAW5ZZC9_LACPA|nr:hypothetical protein [Lacticaseibacillus paracasei]MCP9303911.1 hypothetical protein [Lacticaseibacillus paracasei]MDB1563295.1 hypothetical protein [Lacticaseibacillus paracasei]